MKNLLTAIGLITIVFIDTSCASAYVSSEPTYLEVVGPQQPTPVHVWVGNGWAYNRQSRRYVQRIGYWACREERALTNKDIGENLEEVLFG